MKNKNSLTQERLKNLLHYDLKTGEFKWRIAPNGRIFVGQIAGSPSIEGYIKIKIDCVLYQASRLAWFYMTGEWPPEEVDHKNTINNDNRWDNLRLASRTLNAQNLRNARITNKSTGLLGVTRHNALSGGFQARIRVGGKEKRLGTFPPASQAHEAYVIAKRQYHIGCTI